MNRRTALIITTAGIAIALALIAAEAELRLSGRQPWQSLGIGANEPVMMEPDDELGWRPIPGRYEYPGYEPSQPRIHVTLEPDSTRATGPPRERTADTVDFVGDSLTMGWAISDEETFTWRLQERFPSLRIENHGTLGYSSYQSLLLLERRFREPDPPRAVFYGFMPEHEFRNVANPMWLRLLALFSHRHTVAVPYATLTLEGALLRHPPLAYPEWALRDHSALVTFLEKSYADFAGRDRVAQQREVTEQVIDQMHRQAAAHRAHFTVVLLAKDSPAIAHYRVRLPERGIDVVDCGGVTSGDQVVPGEGHPNGRMNAIWADCLATKLQELLPEIGPAPLG